MYIWVSSWGLLFHAKQKPVDPFLLKNDILCWLPLCIIGPLTTNVSITLLGASSWRIISAIWSELSMLQRAYQLSSLYWIERRYLAQSIQHINVSVSSINICRLFFLNDCTLTTGEYSNWQWLVLAYMLLTSMRGKDPKARLTTYWEAQVLSQDFHTHCKYAASQWSLICPRRIRE